MKKISDIVLCVTSFYGIIILLSLILESLGWFPPFPVSGLDDFVVDGNENVVAVLSFQRRIFYISKQGKVIDSIKIPESKGTTLMAIDSSDNIYINRLRSVEVYALNKKPRLYSVDLDKTNDWILGQDGSIANLNTQMTYESERCTQRNRRAIHPGEFLFFYAKCGSATTAAAYDDFYAHRKIYRCTSFLKNVISVYDYQGRWLYDIRIVPRYLTIFELPLPSIFILTVMGLASWIVIRTREGVSIKKDATKGPSGHDQRGRTGI